MKIYFYFRRNPKTKSGMSMKLWKIERKARRVTVWWGRAVMKHRRPIPSATLQCMSWWFGTEAAAKRDESRRIREQLAQGYERKPRRKS